MFFFACNPNFVDTHSHAPRGNVSLDAPRPHPTQSVGKDRFYAERRNEPWESNKIGSKYLDKMDSKLNKHDSFILSHSSEYFPSYLADSRSTSSYTPSANSLTALSIAGLAKSRNACKSGSITSIPRFFSSSR